MRLGSGRFVFFNLGKTGIQCRNCGGKLHNPKITDLDQVNKAPVVVSNFGKYYCAKCALKLNIIDGVRYA